MHYLLLDGFFFWAFVALFGACSLITIEHSKNGLAAVLLAIFLVLLEVFSEFRPITAFLTNPILVLMYLVGYLFIGSIYSVVKWFSFVYDVRDRANDARKILTKSLPKLFETDDDDAKQSRLRAISREIGVDLPLKASEYKLVITMWMCYWPVSAPWTILNDPLRRLLNGIYNALSGTFQKIADNALGKIGDL